MLTVSLRSAFPATYPACTGCEVGFSLINNSWKTTVSSSREVQSLFLQTIKVKVHLTLGIHTFLLSSFPLSRIQLVILHFFYLHFPATTWPMPQSIATFCVVPSLCFSIFQDFVPRKRNTFILFSFNVLILKKITTFREFTNFYENTTAFG